MKISEITIETLKEYARIDYEDTLLEPILTAAKTYVSDYTGLSLEELEEKEDTALAVLCIATDMYDNRGMNVSSNTKINNTIQSILDRHRVNFIPDLEE